MSEDVLRIKHLVKHYDGGKIQALKGVSLSIKDGEFVSVMGPSGSGKSTLLHLVGGLDIPTSGEIHINGTTITNNKNLDEYRSKTVGFIFQSFHLINTLTALENVQLPMFERISDPHERRERAEILLELVGLEARERHYPAHLSGGERQRVAIARSLANDPQILLADEPTGNLDSKTAAQIINLIQEINHKKGLVVILVTHDENVASHATRKITIFDGMII
ncbi:MAG TPA: ABC transporter ATP-binding protein [bacterium]